MLDSQTRTALTDALSIIGVQMQCIAKLIDSDVQTEQLSLPEPEPEFFPVAVRFTDGAVLNYKNLDDAAKRLCGTSGHIERKYLKPYLNDRLPEGSSKISSITITRKSGQVVEL